MGPGGFRVVRREAVGERALPRDEAEGRRRADAVALLVEARAARAKALAEAEEAAAALALEVARAVLGREAEVGPAVVRDVTRRALARLPRARGVVLRVHPDDAAVVRAQARTWLPEAMAPEVLEVVADGAVARGGVVVDTELGRVDARLDVQLAAITRALAAARAGR